MLPYPSGEPHIGHLKCYSVGDAIAHFHRRLGARVLHPMGYDAFGLPAENHAIKTGVHPRVSTAESIASFQRQFRSWGISIDWSRELATHEPSYYRWTQWIFLELFRAGLAYRKRGGGQVVPQRPDRARQRAGRRRRALRALRGDRRSPAARAVVPAHHRLRRAAARATSTRIDWPEHVKTMQRNWIGRSEGAEVTFRCEELGRRLPRVHDPPGHAVRRDLLRDGARAPRRDAPGRRAPSTSRRCATTSTTRSPRANEERGNAEKPKTGVALGRTVTNPVNGEQIPMYVADYVLMEYGTGAIMAVPGHDERDYAFARAFELPIRRVIVARAPAPAGIDGTQQDWERSPRACPTPATACSSNSHPDFDGMGNREALARDRRVARPRGQGPRFGQLPPARLAGLPTALLGLPDPDRLLRELRDGAGARGAAAGGAAGHRGLHAQGPLAAGGRRGLGQHRAARNCGGAARRETDTMDTFVDSSWYFLRYCDAAQRSAPPGTRRRCASGCPSTSTSAASSTRSCT